MTQNINPYQAPQSPQPLETAPAPVSFVPVGAGIRFANYLIDMIFSQVVLAFGFGLVLGIISVRTGHPEYIDNFATLGAILMILLYYIICEGLFGRTLGKLITGTKVVDSFGHKPGWGKILGRTFARLIPFEALSFFSSDARGWHDSLSGTFVTRTR